MNNEYNFLKKQRYEYYKGTTEIMDNEVYEFVEDIPNEEQTDAITLEQALWLQKKLKNENFKLKEN